MTADWLPNLETFAEVATRGGYSAAARALDTTREVVVERVRALERELGVALVSRRIRRLVPTPAGRLLLDQHIPRIRELHRAARQAVAASMAPVEGDLVVAAGSVPGEHLLPEILSAFKRMHPQVRVHAAVGDSGEAVARVERGEAHVALTSHSPESEHLDSRRVARDRMIVAVPPDHALAEQTRVTLENLAEHPLVVREPGSNLRRGFEAVLKRAGMSLADLKVAAVVEGDAAVREAVLRGDGIGITTTLVVRKDVAAGRLCALKVWGVRCDRDVYVVTDTRRPLTPPARLFLALAGACPADDPVP